MMVCILQLGIPQWMVEIRHSSTHTKSLSSIEHLQQAVSFAFDYIQVSSEYK